MRILICDAKVPFARGGAELLAAALREQLARRGHEVDEVTIPYNWSKRTDLLRCGLAWRMVDLRQVWGQRVDLVIATRFPSYAVAHPNKVVWLVHQVRQAYDWLGTRWSDFNGAPRDARALAMLRSLDARTLGEARARFAISRNVAGRLRRFNGLESEVLYPPSKIAPLLRSGAHGDYVFTAGRLDRAKRFDLLLRALALCATPVRCKIAGEGPERGPLGELARELGIAERIEFLGWVDEPRLADLYAEALAVYYAPYDEDYGYVTIEALLAAKPVVTAADSGGVLEFVEDGAGGVVCAAAAPREFAAAFDRLYRDRDAARRLGESGRPRVAGIGWDEVIRRLTGAV